MFIQKVPLSLIHQNGEATGKGLENNMANLVTLSEFRATRKEVVTTEWAEGAGIDLITFGDDNASLFVYMEDEGQFNGLFIEKLSNGTFYLLTDREGYTADNIEALEEDLYQWACENHFD